MSPTKLEVPELPYERLLDCVHCGLCAPSCPTYVESVNELDSPRGRIHLVRGLVDGRIELTENVLRHLDLCLDCRGCESACPSGVQYGQIIEKTRHAIRAVRAEPLVDRLFREWVLFRLFPYRRRLWWAMLPVWLYQRLRVDRFMHATGLIRLLPNKLARLEATAPRLRSLNRSLSGRRFPAQGEPRAKVAFFEGCIQSVVYGGTNRATVRVLQANGCDVIVPAGQGCCGAIHYHAGAPAAAIQLARQNIAACLGEDVDAIVTNVAGCGAMLEHYAELLGEEAQPFVEKFRDVSEFLAQLGPRPPQGEIPLKATYHDACHLCHAQQVRSAPRELLALIPGLEVVPLPESELCCGSAGTYNLTEPEMSDRLGHRKLQNILSTGAEVCIAANAGCLIQIEKMADGRRFHVIHPMDLLDASYRKTSLLPRVFSDRE